jgi:uncharacterized protein YcfL
MKHFFHTVIVLFILSGCSAGETDKTSPVHESEELNINKDKNADTIAVTNSMQH